MTNNASILSSLSTKSNRTVSTQYLKEMDQTILDLVELTNIKDTLKVKNLEHLKRLSPNLNFTDHGFPSPSNLYSPTLNNRLGNNMLQDAYLSLSIFSEQERCTFIEREYTYKQSMKFDEKMPLALKDKIKEEDFRLAIKKLNKFYKYKQEKPVTHINYLLGLFCCCLVNKKRSSIYNLSEEEFIGHLNKEIFTKNNLNLNPNPQEYAYIFLRIDFI